MSASNVEKKFIPAFIDWEDTIVRPVGFLGRSNTRLGVDVPRPGSLSGRLRTTLTGIEVAQHHEESLADLLGFIHTNGVTEEIMELKRIARYNRGIVESAIDLRPELESSMSPRVLGIKEGIVAGVELVDSSMGLPSREHPLEFTKGGIIVTNDKGNMNIHNFVVRSEKVTLDDPGFWEVMTQEWE